MMAPTEVSLKRRKSSIGKRDSRSKHSVAMKSAQKGNKMRQQMKSRRKMMDAARIARREALASDASEISTDGSKRGERIVLMRRKNKSRNRGDQELMEKYGAEVVDLTDLSVWGDFEAAYQEPTGARERNKMLKKAKNVDESAFDSEGEDEDSDGGFEEDFDNNDEESSDSEEDEDVEEILKEMEANCTQNTEDGAEDLEDSDEDNEDDEGEATDEEIADSDESVEQRSLDESQEESEDDEEMMSDDGDEDNRALMKKMPFKGPLAPKTQQQANSTVSVVQDTSSSMAAVYCDNGDSADESMDHEQSEIGVAQNEHEGLSEKSVAKCVDKVERRTDSSEVKLVEDDVELTVNERRLTKNWELFSINNCILKALAELKYTEPTEIQSECLMPAMRDRLDILGAAETGSGKTLAFGIPLVNRLIQDGKRNKIGALILTPTRELAIQIRKHLTDITKFTSLHVVTIVGGLCHEKQMRLIKKRPEIIVATPGRLFEILQDDPSFQEELTDIRCLVIDEADRMIQEGHFEEMKLIVKFMNQNQVSKRQNLVFSATLTMDPHLPERVIEKKKNKKLSRLDQLKAILRMPKPKVIDLSRKVGTAETLTESRVFCEKPEHKDALLYYFVSLHPGRTLVFCNSIDCVRRLKSVLETLGLHPMALHAEMQQRQRLRQLDKFVAEPNSLLIATDVAARGLDIKNVEHVIHFNVSKASETYIHRSGRTARVKQSGLSVMLVDGRELPQYRKLLQALKRNEDLPAFPMQENILKACKARLGKARELEVLKHRQRKMSKTNGWFIKCAQEADIELDDDMLVQKQWSDDRKERVKVEKLHHELKMLLKKPLIPLNQRVGQALNMPDRDPLKLVRGAKGILE